MATLVVSLSQSEIEASVVEQRIEEIAASGRAARVVLQSGLRCAE